MSCCIMSWEKLMEFVVFGRECPLILCSPFSTLAPQCPIWRFQGFKSLFLIYACLHHGDLSGVVYDCIVRDKWVWECWLWVAFPFSWSFWKVTHLERCFTDTSRFSVYEFQICGRRNGIGLDGHSQSSCRSWGNLSHKCGGIIVLLLYFIMQLLSMISIS